MDNMPEGYLKLWSEAPETWILPLPSTKKLGRKDLCWAGLSLDLPKLQQDLTWKNSEGSGCEHGKEKTFFFSSDAELSVSQKKS